jgi:hypothetical protein
VERRIGRHTVVHIVLCMSLQPFPVEHHNLPDPTPTRVRTWIHSIVWGATLVYLIVGMARSAFVAACGRPMNNDPNKSVPVQGNILLNFDPNDPLLLVGRLCLAATIALAFAVLTIQARDIFPLCFEWC